MDKKIKDVGYWLCLGKNPRIGAVGFRQILEIKENPNIILSSSESELRSLGLSNKLIKEILYCQEHFTAEQVLSELKRYKISAITINNPSYPKPLKEIYDPPMIIYYRGKLDLNALMVGIVGSRKPTDYGRHVTYDTAYKLASNGICIVSGLALGIDSIAHQAAIDAGGKTVAVMGCGLDRIYPTSHEKLANKIISKGGSIISEFPIGTPPMKYNFPARNRIISGLSQALIVTEASKDSGSLITATNALEQNREVFAIPGSIHNKNSSGPNNLIKHGAHLMESVSDIYDELGLKSPESAATVRKIVPKNHLEGIVIECLKDQPKHIDQIIKEAGLGHNQISSTLTIMEIGGKVKHLGGLTYRLNN